MSNPKIRLNSKASVIVGHVCSRCGYPVLSSVTIQVNIVRTYNFFTEKAEKAASESADKALRDEIERINLCKEKHNSLGNNPNEKGEWIEFETFRASSISGITSPCPYCHNVEPWQMTKVPPDQMDGLNVINFPVVFESMQPAKEWAANLVARKISWIKEMRMHPEEIAKAEQELATAQFALDSLKKQLNDFPEIAEKNRLSQEEKQLVEERKASGLLDFKKKKSIDERLTEISTRINEANSAIAKKDAELRKQIINEELRLHLAKLLTYGCTGYFLCHEQQNTICYSAEPCDKQLDSDASMDTCSEADASPDILDDAHTDITAEAPADIPNDGLIDPKDGQFAETSAASEPTQTGGIKFCYKCGACVPQGSVFCPRCGVRLKG